GPLRRVDRERHLVLAPRPTVAGEEPKGGAARARRPCEIGSVGETSMTAIAQIREEDLETPVVRADERHVIVVEPATFHLGAVRSGDGRLRGAGREIVDP